MPIPVPNPYDTLPEVPSFTVTSGDFAEGERLSTTHVHDSAGGQNVSPSLSWSGAPAQARGFAVTCYDPDAPTTSGFWHWVVIGLGPDVTSLPTGAGAEGGAGLPSGAVTIQNDMSRRAYDGSAPPPGHGDHRYIYAVHALDTGDLGIPDSVTPGYAGFNIVGHTIARGTITGIFSQ
jgi:Raf kinase inhibitor-like YbhB/YbcL family protein